MKKIILISSFLIFGIIPAIVAIYFSLQIYQFGDISQPLTEDILPSNISNRWDLASVIFTVAGGYVTALTVFIAAITYMYSEKAEKKHRENAAHNELNERYVSFLELTLNNIDLGVQDFDLPHCNLVYSVEHSAPDFLKYKKQIIIYEILNSLLERAFVVYRNQDSDFKEQQWSGWISYAIEWFSRDDFSSIWMNFIQCDDYDKKFNDFMVSCKYQGELLRMQVAYPESNKSNVNLSTAQINSLLAWKNKAIADRRLTVSVKTLIENFGKVRKNSQIFIDKIQPLLDP